MSSFVGPTLLLQDQGLALHLRKASVQWSSDAQASTLWSALLLHDLSLAPGERSSKAEQHARLSLKAAV